MDIRFKDVKILVWDFDGTLYKPNLKIWNEILEAAYKTIMNHTGWTREHTRAEFNTIYKVKTPSVTETSALLSGIPLAQAAYENELYKDRSPYLKPDPKLVELFSDLKDFTHYMLVNGIQEVTRKSLLLLGLMPDYFMEIVTSEVVGENKPSEKGFRHILHKTKLPANQHLMIGDREIVDLEPAKKLGMKTCLVWSEIPGKIADVTLSTVYDIKKILI